MKKIKTNNFKKCIADMIESPMIMDETPPPIKKKKKKYIYQLNKTVVVPDENE